ncbi:YoaP domain-containing protein, partial [Hydrogenoanaerobacterium saccharovorans]
PAPYTSYSLFYNGEFVTHEILNDKKFDKVLADKGL